MRRLIWKIVPPTSTVKLSDKNEKPNTVLATTSGDKTHALLLFVVLLLHGASPSMTLMLRPSTEPLLLPMIRTSHLSSASKWPILDERRAMLFLVFSRNISL